MKVKASFFVIYDVDPKNYSSTDIREMVLEDIENGFFGDDDLEFVLVDAVKYDDVDDNIETRHEVRVQAADLAREL